MAQRSVEQNTAEGSRIPERKVQVYWYGTDKQFEHRWWNKNMPMNKDSTMAQKLVMMVGNPKREVVAPFMMKGKINNKQFEAMIDSGSPVTIFPKKELKEILQTQFLFVSKMPESEKYVDYNGQQLDLLGIFKGRVEVNNKVIEKARILVSQDGTKAIVGRDWMRQLAYKIQPAGIKNHGENSVMRVEKEEDVKKSVDLQKLEGKFPKLFTRKGKFKGFKVKANFKKDMKPTKQKGRKILAQLQESVLKE